MGTIFLNWKIMMLLLQNSNVFCFFHPDDTRAARVYQKIGLAYRAQGLWQEAISTMRNAMLYALNDEEKLEYQLELAVTLIASQNYDLARFELIKVKIRTPSVPLYRRALFLQAVALIYQFRWEEAREVLRHYTTDEMLDILFDKAVNLPQKSPKIAKVLSTILPGTGQIYAGNWRGGLNALALNGVFGFVAVNSVLDRHYVDAVSWTYFIFQRYYLGNLYQSGKAVVDFNDYTSRRAADNILKRLQEIVDAAAK